MNDDKSRSGVGRRRVLLATLGAVSATTAGVIGWSEYQTRRHKTREVFAGGRPGVLPPAGAVPPKRRLGRTGLMVSSVSIGAGALDSTRPIHRAVEHGLNYIDTSTCYGESEDVIGRAIGEDKSLRDKLVIATKWDPGPDTKKGDILASLEKSLKRLRVDVIDVMQVHWLGGGHTRPDDGFNRLDNPELYEAIDEAKKSGKVRFFGATSHDAKRAAILEHAIDKKAFDVLLVKMNVLDFEGAGVDRLLSKAKEHDVAVVAMKSQPAGGVVPKEYTASKLSVFQANLRWTLDQDVATVVHSSIGFDEKAQDLAIGASLEEFGELDRELLEGYAELLSPDYCRGCGHHCEPACPDGVKIRHVLHFGMYDEAYGWHDEAKRHYGALPAEERWSERCIYCTACTEACPFGVDAADRVRRVHARLG